MRRGWAEGGRAPAAWSKVAGAAGGALGDQASSPCSSPKPTSLPTPLLSSLALSLGWRQRARAVTISSTRRPMLPTVARGTASLPTTTARRWRGRNRCFEAASCLPV